MWTFNRQWQMGWLEKVFVYTKLIEVFHRWSKKRFRLTEKFRWRFLISFIIWIIYISVFGLYRYRWMRWQTFRRTEAVHRHRQSSGSRAAGPHTGWGYQQTGCWNAARGKLKNTVIAIDDTDLNRSTLSVITLSPLQTVIPISAGSDPFKCPSRPWQC